MARPCTHVDIVKFGFDFARLWDTAKAIYEACPNDTRLSVLAKEPSAPEYLSLTYEACTEIAGPHYNLYGGFTIWSRLTTWKFPLLQLVAAFPRPSLTTKTELFVIAHLLGDPIDTLTNLLLKLSDCQEAALRWQESSQRMPSIADRDEEGGNDNHVSQKDRLWKALALITDAYSEWGMAMRSEEILLHIEDKFRKSERADSFQVLVIEVAEALAADKATKYLPTSVALILFIASIALSFIKTRSAIGTASLNSTTFIGIEAHGIAFSTLFFWIIPAVFLGSVIGVSQTEATIPRILERFHTDLPKRFSEGHDNLPIPDTLSQKRLDLKCTKLQRCIRGNTERIYNGGIYSWKRWNITMTPDGNATKRGANTKKSFPEGDPARKRRYLPYILPYISIGVALASGACVSYRVPPDGLDCRLACELGIFGFWCLSALADEIISHVIPNKAEERKKIMVITYLKDVGAVAATLGFVFATVVGVLNKCHCWTNFGRVSLVFPQRRDIDELLQHRLAVDYPAYIFSGIAVELFVIPGWIWYCYGDAMSVFIQRDDNISNSAWFYTARHKVIYTLRPLWERIRHANRRVPNRVLSNDVRANQTT